MFSMIGVDDVKNHFSLTNMNDTLSVTVLRFWMHFGERLPSSGK